MSAFTAIALLIGFVILIMTLAAIAFYLGILSLMLVCATFWFSMVTLGVVFIFALASTIESTCARLRELRKDPMAEPHGDAPKIPGR